jgi:phosphate:Na+ symporter
MVLSVDIWRLLAGVAVFMIGMRFIEQSLQRLAGRPFKLFLKKQTAHKLRAVLGGAAVTALLQSSSVVNLMILAFVGAGVISMQNALAVMLGANLGTTMSSWLIVFLGFRINVDIIALPITAIAGITMVLSAADSRLANWSRFFAGIGFLFIGLGMMKSGMEVMMKIIDLQSYNYLPVIVFFAAGLLITTLIQSSSATVALTLSALFMNAVSFYQATAIVLGSEIGTALKLPIASIKGSAVKKRTAAGNLLFNSTTAIVVFLFLQPVNYFITDILSVTDKLIGLVLFQSLVNIFSILLFFPILNRLGRFLEKQFRQEAADTLFIHKIIPEETDLALDALRRETKNFFQCVIDFCLNSFGQAATMAPREFQFKTPNEKYRYIKYLYGQMHEYYINIQKNAGERTLVEKLERLIAAVRNGMYAAKSIQDARPDIEQLRNSSNDVKYNFYRQTAKNSNWFYQNLVPLLDETTTTGQVSVITQLYRSVSGHYNATLRELYQESITQKVSETEITTMLNFNREIFTSFKSMIFALKDYLLDEKEAAVFEALPGFIH